jgi:hypothetical protein
MLTADYADERGSVKHADRDETKFMGKSRRSGFCDNDEAVPFKTTRNQSSLDGRDPSLHSG